MIGFVAIELDKINLSAKRYFAEIPGMYLIYHVLCMCTQGGFPISAQGVYARYHQIYPDSIPFTIKEIERMLCGFIFFRIADIKELN